MDQPFVPKGDFQAKSQASRHFSLRAMAVSIFPVLEWLPAYSVKDNLRADLVGGLTLGCVLMGQSLAHAELCHVSLIHGPYSCILPPLVYAIFGTSVHASVGTGGLVSLLTGEQLVDYGDIEERTRVGTVLTLLVGLILTLMGICRLAFLVRFLSRPALSGFITASATLIILSQLAPLLGLPEWASKGGIVEIVTYHTSNLRYTNVATLCLSVCALTFLMNAKRLKTIRQLKFISDFKELILLGASGVFAWKYNAAAGESTQISIVGSMPSGLPTFVLPATADDFRLMHELLPAAILVALVVFLSSFAGAKKFAMQDGYQVKAFNELVALGMANAVGSFNGAVPTQIGLSRMGIAHQCGVMSQMGANISVSAIVASITMAFSPYLYNIPKCVLNCIIVNGASHLFEFKEAQTLYELSQNSRYNWKCRMDIVVWVGGFLFTLYFGAFQGMLSAVVMSLFLILYQVVNPDITALGYKKSTATTDVEENHRGKGGRDRKWMAISKIRDDIVEEEGILVCRLEGPLFYANVETLQEWLEEQELAYIDKHGTTFKGIVLTASAIPFLDTTAIQTLEEMIKTYSERNVLFFIANTFGAVGRLVTDHLEKLEAKVLKNQGLKEQMLACSSVDDFVRLILANQSSRRNILTAGARSSIRSFIGTPSSKKASP